MCEGCRPPKQPRYVGNTLILEPVTCDCKCPKTILSNPPRCEKCGHVIRIQLTDDTTTWEEQPLWIDRKTKRPVRLDEVKGLT